MPKLPTKNDAMKRRLSDFLMAWYENDGEYESGADGLVGILEAEVAVRLAAFKAALFAIDHDVAQRVIVSVERAVGK